MKILEGVMDGRYETVPRPSGQALLTVDLPFIVPRNKGPASRTTGVACHRYMNNSPNVSVKLEPSTVLYEVLPNLAKPPFDNLTVRKAAAMALDREAITNAITLGHATVANSTLPNALNYYDKNVSPPAYDPEGARKLLDDAGLLGTEINMMIVPSSAQTATLLKAQWDAVGFKTNVEQVDVGLFWSKLTEGDYEVTTTWYYNETEDPDLAVRWALCGTCGSKSFYTNYENPEC